MNLAEAYKRAKEFDIIHTHIDLWELYFAPFDKTISLHTIHNPLYTTKILKKNIEIATFKAF
jgi:hypothetical protein